MAVEAIPFRAEHLGELEIQAHQRAEFERLEPADWLEIERGSDVGETVLAGSRVVACYGTIPIWPGRAFGWSYLSVLTGRHMVAVHRAVRAFVEVSVHRRLEAIVYGEYAPAHRWLHLLGFRLEAPRMRAYFADGADGALYARVR